MLIKVSIHIPQVRHHQSCKGKVTRMQKNQPRLPCSNIHILTAEPALVFMHSSQTHCKDQLSAMMPRSFQPESRLQPASPFEQQNTCTKRLCDIIMFTKLSCTETGGEEEGPFSEDILTPSGPITFHYSIALVGILHAFPYAMLRPKM